jgi:hypothetical protein
MTEPTSEQMRCGFALYGPPAICTCGKCEIKTVSDPCDCKDSDVIVECDHRPTEPLWVVRCRSCGWQGTHENTKLEAILAWNNYQRA